MSNIYQGAIGLIGNTPLVEFTHMEEKYSLKAKLLAKLEYFNPAGSVKDRIAKEMIEQAEADGKLNQVIRSLSQLLVTPELVLQQLRQQKAIRSSSYFQRP